MPRRQTEELPRKEYVERLCEHIGIVTDAGVDFFRTVHELQDFMHYTKPDTGLKSDTLHHMISERYQSSAKVMKDWGDLARMLELLGLLEERQD